jgi:aspartate aminotransferase
LRHSRPRAAIADKLRRDNNIDWKPDNIVVSTGAKQSLANALLCLVNPGDEVLIFSPYWVSYSEMVKAGRRRTRAPRRPPRKRLQGHGRTTGRSHHAAYQGGYVLFPLQPDGAVFSEAELRAIADVIARHENIFVLADEFTNTSCSATSTSASVPFPRSKTA